MTDYYYNKKHKQSNYWRVRYDAPNSGAGERYAHLHVSNGSRECVIYLTYPFIIKGAYDFSSKEIDEIKEIAEKYMYRCYRSSKIISEKINLLSEIKKLVLMLKKEENENKQIIKK